MGKIFFIKIFKLFFYVQVTVEENITVGRMIVFLMEGNKLFLSEVRNFFRIAAGLKGIRRIRHESLENFRVKKVLRGGSRSLHLIKHNAAVAQRFLRAFDFIMPALLHEDFLFLVHSRIEYGIKIHIHEILEVLVVTACNRIHCLIRVCHGVKERVERALYKFNKRFLQRIFSRTAERGVLYNMRHSCIILRRCPEGNRKHLIIIIVLYKEKTRAALFMQKLISF